MWKLWTGASLLEVRRLFPDPAAVVSVPEMYRDIVRTRPTDRPWVGLCMVASIDGSAALDGRSGGLSSPADSAVMHALRDSADLIIVGAGTAMAEQYGPPRKAGQRVGVVTATGRIDAGMELFTSGAGFLITTEAAPHHGLEAVRSGGEWVDLAGALAQLDATFVQAEGGPTLNAALLEHDLVDEVNLTVSPSLVGGNGPRLTKGAAERLQRMTLAQVCDHDGYVFLRYVRAS